MRDFDYIDIDEDIIEYLKQVYSNELSFDKDVKFEEYMYRCGISEVIQHLEDLKKNKARN